MSTSHGWEYKWVIVNGSEHDLGVVEVFWSKLQEKTLFALSQEDLEGWELVSANVENELCHLFFKRQRRS